MKKLTKVLSVFLAMIVLLSVFGVSALAISSKSTPQELLAYYEKALRKNSAKDIIRGSEVYETWDEYDYSGLSGKALEAVKAETAELSTGKHQTSTSDYYYGDKFEDEYISGVSRYVSRFSIKAELDANLYTLKSATYTKNSNGSETIVFNCQRGPEATPYKCTYTVRISKTGYVTHYIEDRVGVYNEYSSDRYQYKLIQHTVERYEFLCQKVPATSIELSETSVDIPLMDSKEIFVKVNPSDATFKDFDVHIIGDSSSFDITKTDEGVRVYAVDGGVATLVVTDVAENVVATCTVTCEVGFFQRIVMFFRLIYVLILGSLAGF